MDDVQPYRKPSRTIVELSPALALILSISGTACPNVNQSDLPCIARMVHHALPEGPYLAEVTTGQIFQVRRQCDDPCQAFISVLTSVPSRLYEKPTAERPLAGVSPYRCFPGSLAHLLPLLLCSCASPLRISSTLPDIRLDAETISMELYMDRRTPPRPIYRD